MCTEMCGHGQLEGALVKNSIFQKPMYPCLKVQFIYTSNCTLLQLVVTGPWISCITWYPLSPQFRSPENVFLSAITIPSSIDCRRRGLCLFVVFLSTRDHYAMPHASRSPIYPQAQRDLVVWFSSCLISFPLFTYINRCREISNPL
jgi:hypothetical protein